MEQPQLPQAQRGPLRSYLVALVGLGTVPPWGPLRPGEVWVTSLVSIQGSKYTDEATLEETPAVFQSGLISHSRPRVLKKILDWKHFTPKWC